MNKSYLRELTFLYTWLDQLQTYNCSNMKVVVGRQIERHFPRARAISQTGSIPNLVCILWLGKIKLRSLGYVSSPYWIFCCRVYGTLGSACDTVLLFRWSVCSPKWTKCLNGFCLCWWLGCEVGSLIQILFKFVPSLTAFDFKLSSI